MNTVILVLWVCICRSPNFIVMWYISYFIQSNIQHLGYSNFASHLFSMVVVMCFFVLSACRLLLILFKLLTKNIQRYSTVLKLRGMIWQNKKYFDSLDNRLPQIHIHWHLSSTGTYVDGGLWYYLFLFQFQWQILISCLLKCACTFSIFLSRRRVRQNKFQSDILILSSKTRLST